MKSDLAECFDELLAANDESCGTEQFVTIDGRKVRAIIEEITTDEILISGGNAEAGGFRAKCRKADFAEQPEQGSEIRKFVDGPKLEILNVIERNGVEYEIVAGQVVAEEG